MAPPFGESLTKGWHPLLGKALPKVGTPFLGKPYQRLAPPFGESLTKGWHPFWGKPYQRMAPLLGKALPKDGTPFWESLTGGNCHITAPYYNQGSCGEQNANTVPKPFSTWASDHVETATIRANNFCVS